MFDTTTLIITFSSFLAAYVNAAFATGGFFVILAIITWVLPITTALPLTPALIYTSLIARVGWFWEHTNWFIVWTFCVGSIFGVFLGANTFIYLSEAILSLSVGTMMVIIIWLPKIGYQPKMKYPYIPVGLVHGFLTTAIGGSAILQMIIMRTNLMKKQVTGTLASCFLIMEAMRVAGYASVGFNYKEHIPVIIFASITGILGTWVGKHTEHFISEKNFRIIFRWLLTFIALRLIYKGYTIL
jgi:uncharacterized membrane protein YfcA